MGWWLRSSYMQGRFDNSSGQMTLTYSSDISLISSIIWHLMACLLQQANTAYGPMPLFCLHLEAILGYVVRSIIHWCVIRALKSRGMSECQNSAGTILVPGDYLHSISAAIEKQHSPADFGFWCTARTLIANCGPLRTKSRFVLHQHFVRSTSARFSASFNIFCDGENHAKSGWRDSVYVSQVLHYLREAFYKGCVVVMPNDLNCLA